MHYFKSILSLFIIFLHIHIQAQEEAQAEFLANNVPLLKDFSDSKPQNYEDYWSKQINKSLTLLTQKKYNEALSIAEEMLMTVKNKAANDNHKLSQCYNLMALVEIAKSDYQQSILFLNKALDYYQKSTSKNNFELASIYQKLSDNHAALGNTQLALEYQYKALDLIGQEPKWRVNSLNSLGNIYLTLRNYDSALKYFQEALQLQQTISPSIPDKLAMLVNNIGLVFLEQKKYDEALAKFQEVFAMQKDSFPEKKINNAGLYLNIGMSYKGQKQYTTALETLQKARLLFEQTQLKHKNLSNVHLQISKIHLQLNQSDSALVYCQKALLANIPYFNLMDTDEMPNISESLDPILFLETLQTKGIIFRKMYQMNPKNKYLLTHSTQCFVLADKLIANIEQKQLRQADKMEFAQKKKQVYSQTLDTYWEQIKKP